ncbi:18150_t:CDS:1 [Gigaspora margarita]|uniref:18150_t:CDS:1 n=1 Tax=Gigaspora margarita TaxID=4874 RepID=A0ABN7VTY8_GIGMA|nr:18150_t:CDS:1 [Gigaspora margarita]
MYEFGEYSDTCIVEGCGSSLEETNYGYRYRGSFCSYHENNHHSCQESGCYTIISYGSYCSQHDSACGHCGKRTSRSFCDSHSTKCQSCSQIISYRETYCSSHQHNCYYGSYRCQQRVSSYGEYCEYHKNSCRFESCGERIPQYNNYGDYCQSHRFEEQTKIYRAR